MLGQLARGSRLQDCVTAQPEPVARPSRWMGTAHWTSEAATGLCPMPVARPSQVQEPQRLRRAPLAAAQAAEGEHVTPELVLGTPVGHGKLFPVFRRRGDYKVPLPKPNAHVYTLGPTRPPHPAASCSALSAPAVSMQARPGAGPAECASCWRTTPASDGAQLAMPLSPAARFFSKADTLDPDLHVRVAGGARDTPRRVRVQRGCQQQQELGRPPDLQPWAHRQGPGPGALCVGHSLTEPL